MNWTKKLDVMNRYDVTAQMYEERYSEEQVAKYKKTLENANLSRDRTVLDVGCGSGMFFHHIADKAHYVVGVDVSRKLLLKAKGQTKIYRNVFVVQADADHLPFKDEFFDAVFSFTVLQNMPNPKESLSELKRAAKCGGTVAVTGLKKFFKLNDFLDIIENSCLQATSFFDDEPLKCYITICKK